LEDTIGTKHSFADTYFAPAGRLDKEALHAQAKEALNNPIIQVLLESAQGYLLILNEQRQILTANPELLEALNLENPDWLRGLRPGELLNCTHFSEGPDGCGTSVQCQSCGAVLAILGSQSNGSTTSGECSLSTKHGDKTEIRFFRVNATPLSLGEHNLTIFSVLDINTAKRLELLDEIFLHDLLNSLGCIEEMHPTDSQATALRFQSIVRHLKEEIQYHRSLIEAEKGTLKQTETWISTAEALIELKDLLANNPRTGRQAITFKKDADDRFYIDKILLIRVLFNMALNAIEASSPEEVVTIEYKNGTFSVHNPGFISEDIAKHIFEHSFSTKGRMGRGLGTYGMKLLGEEYLGGTVSFSTLRESGTIFKIQLPETRITASKITDSIPSAIEGIRPPLHILLIDDFEPLVRLGKLFLEREGYRVTTKTDVLEALLLIQDNPETFGLVITDMSMPDIDGLELARRIHNHSPELPIVLCSGHGNIHPEGLETSGVKAVISKPLDPKEIVHIIQQMR
jgi:CheY-like chemotaxis protein